MRILALGLLVGVCAFLGQGRVSLRLAFSPGPVKESTKHAPRFQVIGLADAIQFYYRTNVVFLDVRMTNFYSFGHITGAFNMIPSQIKSDSANLTALKRFKYCIVYCNNSGCGAAAESATILSQLGATNLLVYAGGWEEWMSCHLPTSTQNDNRL